MAAWRKSSVALVIALTGGATVQLAPLGVAQVLTTATVAVGHTCDRRDNSTIIGDHPFRSTVSPDDVAVRYPATVSPGEVFTVYAQPGAMRTSSAGNFDIGRLSYDFKLPENSVNLAATDNGGAYGFSTDPTVLRVDRANASGGVQGDGGFARVWGGASAALGNTNDGTWINDWQGGLQVAPNTQFRLPEVALRMRAPVSAGGQSIAVGLKGAGGSPSLTNAAANALSGAEKSGGAGAYSLRFFCAASQNAAALTSTVVDSSRPRYIAQTATDMTSGGAHLARSNRSATLSARVSTNEELMLNVAAGGAQMRFDIKDLSTGAIIASPTATINTSSGVASTSFTFPDISGGEVRDNYEVTATYTGRADDIDASSSNPVTYTVGYNEINAGVALRSTNGALAGGSMPVTLAADLTMPSGRTFPANLFIQLYRNDVPHGSPVAISSGGSTKTITFPTDNLPQQQDTTTYRYRAEIVPLIINDLDRYAGQSAVSVAAIVTGTNPGSALPEGGEGSVSLEGFFRAPQRVWDWLTGSIGQAGTFSVAFTR